MENTVITQLQNRKSIRQFTGEVISDAHLELIFKTAQRAATSINAQQISLVYTRDKAKLARIAELCGGQAHVATADVFVGIVVDFNRTSAVAESLGKHQVIEQSAEGIIIGAVDAGIMLNHLQSAAEALGYGTTCLGSVRNSMAEFVTLFNLPKKTLLLVGTTIGVPTEKAKNAPLKPRVALDSFVMEDTYDSDKVRSSALTYEKDFKEFRETTGSAAVPSYSEKIVSNYTDGFYRKTGKVFEAQGFAFKDE